MAINTIGYLLLDRWLNKIRIAIKAMDKDHKRPWGVLSRKKHVQKLIEGLTGPLPKHFEKLVPSQTWTVYWITHSLALLEQQSFITTVTEDVIKFISESAHPEGGYGGGPGQVAHLATTFASINALVTLNCEQALESIDRLRLLKFLQRMKQNDGSFTMHDDGEIDSRATYCALAVMRCLNIHSEHLLDNVADWIISCQTYEGGFGSVPGSEAHGGYTFCCVASLCLLNQLPRANVPALLRWLSNKQLTEEGGFCGRSNKLVDSCYSYWQGAVFPLLHPFLDSTQEPVIDQSNLDNWLYDCAALQSYILNKCQANMGLLRDKPDAEPDFYHTCYALSGLSLSQHQPDDSIFDIGSKPINILTTTHPLFNLTITSLNDCFDYFANKKIEVHEADNQSEPLEEETEGGPRRSARRRTNK